MNNVTVLNHPLVGTALLTLRDKATPSNIFRDQVRRLSHMLMIEATRDLQTEKKECETPICKTQENVVSETVSIVPILRAAIGMVDASLDLLPEAKTLFLGMYRDEKTHEPVSYYNKSKDTKPTDVAYVLDPMLATGGSALLAIKAVQDWGVKKIKFVGLIGAPEGVKALHDVYPNVDIYLAALDEKLNEQAYIVPGLGDAGDRVFNT